MKRGRAVSEGAGLLWAGGELERAWDEDGVWRFEGVAASGALDRQGERLGPAALAMIAESQGLEMRAGHRGRGRVGTIETCWLDGQEVRVQGQLDGQSPEAAKLYRRLRRGEKWALSVGGKVTAARWTWDAEVERPVRVIEAVEVDHVATCRPEEAVNPETWLVASPLRKVAELCKGVSGLWRRGERERGRELSERLAGLEARLDRLAAEVSETGEAAEDAQPAAECVEAEAEEAEARGGEATELAKGPAEAVVEVVRRGEPQGLSGQQARPSQAARIWEGVL